MLRASAVIQVCIQILTETSWLGTVHFERSELGRWRSGRAVQVASGAHLQVGADSELGTGRGVPSLGSVAAIGQHAPLCV